MNSVLNFTPVIKLQRAFTNQGTVTYIYNTSANTEKYLVADEFYDMCFEK